MSDIKYTGRVVPLDYVEGTGKVKPASGAYKPVGAVNTKSFTLSADEADSTADDTTGGIKEALTTYLNYEVSADGKARNGDGTKSNHAALLKYFVSQIAAGKQPGVWTRLTFPDITIEAYCVITNLERGAPDSDAVTYSISFKATASDFGVVISDTPTA